MRSIVQSSSYLLRGAALLLNPGYKRFILIPILSNIILFILTISAFIGYFEVVMSDFNQMLPDWLSWMGAVVWVLLLFLLMFLYGLTFTSITNLIAAPFNGFLAEKIWEDQTGQKLPEESMASLIFRTLGRELRKLMYFIFWGILVSIGLFLLSFIPLLNLLVPLLGLMWACWVLALQYTDYAADNLHVTFDSMRRLLRENYWQSMIFGGTIFLLTLIPIVNIFVMSAAVAGGTLYWLECHSPDLRLTSKPSHLKY